MTRGDGRNKGRLRTLAQRGRNALRRWSHGLRVRPESISPLEANDLFIAHLSIYAFGARYAIGSRVLDLGCGTGYGSSHLLAAGAREVVGIDLDPKAIRFAQRRYQAAGLTYRVANAEQLPADLGGFDFVLSSNVFEHLEDPEAAISSVRSLLAGDGHFLMVVPPISDDRSLAENEQNPFHRSNLFVTEWRELLERHFGAVSCYQHATKAGTSLDFFSPFRSELSTDDFEFEMVESDQLTRVSTIGAVFVCVPI